MKFDAKSLTKGSVTFFGHYDFDVRPKGISPRRLPDWTRNQIPEMMNVVVRMPSGVRMVFETDADSIELQVQTTRMVYPPQAPRPVVFDLKVDGHVVDSYSSANGNTILIDRMNPQDYTMEKGDAYTVRFSALGAQMKRCEIWLPHNAFVEIQELYLTNASVVNPVSPPQQDRWLHYGSSISHCMEAEQPTGSWPAVAAEINNLHLINLGFGGQCHLDQFVARTIRDTQTDLITIKTGINVVNMDSMRERAFIPALHGFLDTIREGQPDTPIVLISPIFCPSAETRPGPTIPDSDGKFITLQGHEEIQGGCLTLTRIREIIAELVAIRQQAGDNNVFYLNGLSLFSADDAADLPDDLHPNPQGYKRMGQRFAAAIENCVKAGASST
jgi:hypothetical protein